MEIYIIACGARTPLGLRAWTSAAAVRAGISRLDHHPYLIDSCGSPMRVAMDRVMDAELEGEQRMLVLAESALREVCELLGAGLQRSLVYLALPEPRPGWPSSAISALIRLLLARVAPGLPSDRVRPLPAGHAAALTGVVHAVEALRSGGCDVAVVGGVDSYIHVDTLEWLDQSGQLYCDDRSRSSFIPGEGAGFFALATEAWCRTHRANPLARLLGIAAGHEPKHIRAKAVCVGEGLSSVVREATRGLSFPEEKIGETFCDLNGERYRTEEFAFSALRNYQAFFDANRFFAPADCWGDVGAASGPMLTILSVAAGLRGYARNSYSMILLGSEGGLRGAMVLAASKPFPTPS